jgi:hypothetical protein
MVSGCLAHIDGREPAPFAFSDNPQAALSSASIYLRMVRTAALDASHHEERMEGEIMKYTFLRRRRIALTMGMGLLARAAP